MEPCRLCGTIAFLDDDGLCPLCAPDEDAGEARTFRHGGAAQRYAAPPCVASSSVVEGTVHSMHREALDVHRTYTGVR